MKKSVLAVPSSSQIAKLERQEISKREDLMQWRIPLFVDINGILRSCIISNN